MRHDARIAAFVVSESLADFPDLDDNNAAAPAAALGSSPVSCFYKDFCIGLTSNARGSFSDGQPETLVQLGERTLLTQESEYDFAADVLLAY